MISTHTPLTGRDQNYIRRLNYQRISTHTPLTGRDGRRPYLILKNDISTHTPLTGRDAISIEKTAKLEFLLTRPLRDVTN